MTPPDRPTAALPVFGWKEFVTLPDWGLELRAKLDTGARSSALHVSDLDEVGAITDPETGTRLPMVRFDVVLGPKDAPQHHEVETAIVREQIVKDTRGRPERRAVVRTRIVCGPLDTHADISLTDRSGMNFRMLLGRRALEHQALVDPARGYLVTSPRGFGGSLS